MLSDQAYAAFRHSLDATLEGRRVEFETEIPDTTLERQLNLHRIHEPERTVGEGKSSAWSR